MDKINNGDFKKIVDGVDSKKYRMAIGVSHWNDAPIETYHHWIEVIQDGWLEVQSLPANREDLISFIANHATTRDSDKFIPIVVDTRYLKVNFEQFLIIEV